MVSFHTRLALNGYHKTKLVPYPEGSFLYENGLLLYKRLINGAVANNNIYDSCFEVH